MKILPNLMTVDSDRANFPLYGGIQDFLVHSNEPKGALKSTVFIQKNPTFTVHKSNYWHSSELSDTRSLLKWAFSS